MPEVTIYTRPGCGYCRRAKELLSNKGIRFKEFDVGEHPEKWESVKKETGRRTVPQIFIGSFHVGGCDDLMAMEAKGGLDERLGIEGKKKKI